MKIGRTLKRSGLHENRQGGVYKKISRDSKYIGLGTIHRKGHEDDEAESATQQRMRNEKGLSLSLLSEEVFITRMMSDE